MSSTFLVGSTGLVGRHIMELLSAHPSISAITTISRRVPADSAKLKPIIEADTSTWASTISSLPSPPKIYFSALGTTRGAAGSIAAQRAVDFDLNLDLARAAKESGTEICVLVSSAGSSAKSMVPYSKMKGELEDAIVGLGFEKTVILRPGLIVGTRKERSLGQWVAGNVAGMMGKFGEGWAQDKEVIARAAVRSAVMAVKGEIEGRVWVLGQEEIVRLGRGK